MRREYKQGVTEFEMAADKEDARCRVSMSSRQDSLHGPYCCVLSPCTSESVAGFGQSQHVVWTKREPCGNAQSYPHAKPAYQYEFTQFLFKISYLLLSTYIHVPMEVEKNVLTGCPCGYILMMEGDVWKKRQKPNVSRAASPHWH